MKIITKGYKTKPKDIVYVKKCHTCGCKFTYQLDDLCFGLDDMFINCPDCSCYCNVSFKKKYRGEKE